MLSTQSNVGVSFNVPARFVTKGISNMSPLKWTRVRKFFKNSKNAPEIIDMIPIDRMLIETDSPYLAPEPVRGTRNDSRNVKYTAQKIAELKGLTLEEVAEATYRNAEKLYNIEE